MRIPDREGRTGALQAPTNRPEEREPVEAFNAVMGAGVWNPWPPGRTPPSPFIGHDQAPAQSGQGNYKRICAIAFRVLVHEIGKTHQDVANLQHESFIQGYKQAAPGREDLGEIIRTPLKLAEHLLLGNHVASSDRGIELLPKMSENVRRVILPKADPYAGVDYVGWHPYVSTSTRRRA